jgi:hypothetical protein
MNKNEKLAEAVSDALTTKRLFTPKRIIIAAVTAAVAFGVVTLVKRVRDNNELAEDTTPEIATKAAKA